MNTTQETSPALQFVISRGWEHKVNGEQIELAVCPLCKKNGYNHFYMRLNTGEQKNFDGVWMCQRCGVSGNLYTLKEKLGLVSPEISSQKDWSASEKKIDPLPDTEACHQALLQDADALDYFINFRGFSREIIERQKLGIKDKVYFRGVGEVKAIVYPYLVNRNTVWCHYRTLPDINDLKKVPKAFSSPAGWDSTLYNGEVLKDGLKEVILVEGECNTIAAMDKGIENICGVPGANIKKAEWIDTLDKIGVERIYICYDRDKVGQRAAQVIASRIGIEKCWKIVLPEFNVIPEDGVERKGKDLNEWFTHGGTAEEFEQLKQDATLFDVDGVTSAGDAIDEFVDSLESKGAQQKYVYPLFSSIAQFDEGDCIDLLGEGKMGKTSLGLCVMDYMVETYGENGLVVCLEMTRAKLARKCVSRWAGIPDNLPQTKEEADALTRTFKNAIPSVKSMLANREGDLLLCYPKYSSADDIYKLIIDCIRRYGVKWIMLDNLQRLCDTTLGGKNRTQYLSEISKRLSQICKDYGVQMIRILQPHQIGIGRIVSTRDVDGASQIEKDCDIMFTIHRNRIGEVTKDEIERGGFIETNGSFGPEMYVSAGISRYSSGGSTQIYYDGATSSVFPMAQGKITEMNRKAAVGYQAQIEQQNLSAKLPDDIRV